MNFPLVSKPSIQPSGTQVTGPGAETTPELSKRATANNSDFRRKILGFTFRDVQVFFHRLATPRAISYDLRDISNRAQAFNKRLDDLKNGLQNSGDDKKEKSKMKVELIELVGVKDGLKSELDNLRGKIESNKNKKNVILKMPDPRRTGKDVSLLMTRDEAIKDIDNASKQLVKNFNGVVSRDENPGWAKRNVDLVDETDTTPYSDRASDVYDGSNTDTDTVITGKFELDSYVTESDVVNGDKQDIDISENKDTPGRMQ